MSKSPHVVDGEASESDSEIEVAKSPVSKIKRETNKDRYFVQYLNFYQQKLKKEPYYLS